MTNCNTRKIYDDWSDEYDAYLSDEEKFKDEAMYFADLFKREGAKTVLDCGCGTGRHAVHLALQGFDVTGADLSAGMLEQARARARGYGVAVDFIQSAFEEMPRKLDRKFDAVLCAGAGIAHLIDDASLRQGLKNIVSALNNEGIVVFENRDFEQLREKDLVVGPLATAGDDKGEQRLFLRILNYLPRTMGYNLITLTDSSGEWRFQVRSFDLRRRITDDLQAILPELGLEIEVLRGFTFGSGDHGKTNLVIGRRK
jgi:glycine/sarcosine N-methyltransferase/sarcosine/dimethylglycine N-methyltransferase